MKYELQSTQKFNEWFSGLKDRTVKNRLLARFARIEEGNFGDSKSVGQNLFELRFFFSSGIRVYYTIRGSNIVLLLAGGDKSGQDRDIAACKSILDNLQD